MRGCISPYQVLASPQGIIVNIPVTGIEREELESYRLRFQRYLDRKVEIEEENVLREKEMKKKTIEEEERKVIREEVCAVLEHPRFMFAA